MALKNKVTGEYLKITEVAIGDIFHIGYEVYGDEEQRVNGINDYQKTKMGRYHSDLENLEQAADAKLSVKNNLITLGYLILKNSKGFKDWVDA